MTSTTVTQRMTLEETRQGENHIGVRFGDQGRGMWRVTLDGVEVQELVDEALGGEDGWVHFVGVGKDRLGAMVKQGRVEIALQPFKSATPQQSF